MIFKLFLKFKRMLRNWYKFQFNFKKKKKPKKKYNPQKQARFLYQNSLSKFRLSRSKVENFVRCSRCFYLDVKLGVRHPDSYPFRLNSAVDELLKKEFDLYREQGLVHPYCIEYGIDAIPFAHKDLNKWRNSLNYGISYEVPGTNLEFFGGIDDIWINETTRELYVVDYKATSQKDEVGIDADWQKSYKRQMEMYQWLLRKHGFKVSNTAYFVYCNGKTDVDFFDDKLNFNISILAYEGNDSWVEQRLFEVYECLQSNNIPEYDASSTCDYCLYSQKINTVLSNII